MINAIFATDIEGGMGHNGTLPWPHDREDMLRFKSYTQEHIVVMGSNTWLDPMMPKPLPNRHCVVVSNRAIETFILAHDVIAGNFLSESLTLLEQNNPKKIIWIIGGAKLLQSCHSFITNIYLTTFMNNYECDVKLNMQQYLNNFTKIEEEHGRNKIYSTWARSFNEKLS